MLFVNPASLLVNSFPDMLYMYWLSRLCLYTYMYTACSYLRKCCYWNVQFYY